MGEKNVLENKIVDLKMHLYFTKMTSRRNDLIIKYIFCLYDYIFYIVKRII